MAGISDRAFREICLKYGAGYTVTEMVSSKGLECGSKKTEMIMSLTENEYPSEIQIFGSDPESLRYAAIESEKQGCIGIDINMGCPAPKVSKNGAGSALMKNPELAFKIVKEVTNAVKKPVTVKIRSGWDENSVNAADFAKRLEEAGASAIAVHGRTRKQMYAPPVDLDIIKQVKMSVKIPVIGNGDITDIMSAKRMYEYTGCDFIMIGRGALGRPWIFKQINEYFTNNEIISDPIVEERMRIMLGHIEKLCEYKGNDVGTKEARKHAGWYTKGLRGAAGLRREIGAIGSLDDLRKIADRIIQLNS